jgi:hypothetical protein
MRGSGRFFFVLTPVFLHPKKLLWMIKMKSDFTKNEELTAFQIIQNIYPGKMRFKTADLAVLIDNAEQTIRNQQGDKDKPFKIRSYKEGASRYFDIRDVADYIDFKRGEVLKQEKEAMTLKKIGRPTKAFQMAKKGGV